MIAPLDQLTISNATTRMDRTPDDVEDVLVITFPNGRIFRITIDPESEHYTIWTYCEITSQEWDGNLNIIGRAIRVANNSYGAVGFDQMLKNVGLELSQDC